MLSDLTNFKSYFNNLSNLENFQNENTQAKSSAFAQTPASPKEEQNVKKLFTPVLMPYDFQSHDPIGDLFKDVKLDGNIASPKKASRSKIDSEVSLITECPPGSKPVGEINVNSTYLKCKPDGTPVKPEPKHRFLSEQNSCAFRSKYNNPSSAAANLMPKPANDGTESATDSDQMVTKSANASRVLSEAMSKSIAKSVRSEKSKKSGKGKNKMEGRSLNKTRELSAIKSVSISGSGSDVDVSDSGLSSSSEASSSVSSSSETGSSSNISSTSSKKVKRSDVKSYKQAVEKAAKQKYGNTTTDN
jgi:hypothetical protein